MENAYRISLDLVDEELTEIALAYLMGTKFINRLCVIETSKVGTERFSRLPFDMVVMDKHGSEDDVKDYCRRWNERAPNAVLIHVNPEPVRCDSLRVIGVTRDLFIDYFLHLIGLCFLTRTVRDSISGVKRALRSHWT